MREGKTELPIQSAHFRARYQCEHCGYTGYRSTIEGQSDGLYATKEIRTQMYCAGDCDMSNRWHRLIEIKWTQEIPQPSGEPCLIDGDRYKQKG